MAETNSSDSHKRNFSHGVTVDSKDADFMEAIRAAVDYRGDVTIELLDQKKKKLEGFLFNSTEEVIDIFPKDSPRKESILVNELNRIIFSGEDQAAGKGWDDWVKKREQIKTETSTMSEANA